MTSCGVQRAAVDAAAEEDDANVDEEVGPDVPPAAVAMGFLVEALLIPAPCADADAEDAASRAGRPILVPRHRKGRCAAALVLATIGIRVSPAIVLGDGDGSALCAAEGRGGGNGGGPPAPRADCDFCARTCV